MFSWLILSKQKVVLPYSNFGRLSLGCSAIAIVSLEFAYTWNLPYCLERKKWQYEIIRGGWY